MYQRTMPLERRPSEIRWYTDQSRRTPVIFVKDGQAAFLAYQSAAAGLTLWALSDFRPVVRTGADGRHRGLP